MKQQQDSSSYTTIQAGGFGGGSQRTIDTTQHGIHPPSDQATADVAETVAPSAHCP